MSDEIEEEDESGQLVAEAITDLQPCNLYATLVPLDELRRYIALESAAYAQVSPESLIDYAAEIDRFLSSGKTAALDNIERRKNIKTVKDQ